MKALLLLFIAFSAQAALDPRFEGTADFSNCSGFLFTTPSATSLSKALVMTNGHCWQSFLGSMILKPGEARANQRIGRDVSLVTERGTKIKFKTERLVYATMTGTDMAVYALAQTYAELESRGIRPLLLTGNPQVGEAVEVISGHKNSQHSCAIETTTDTREGGYPFQRTLRLSVECRQGNGTSGSPVLRTGTREVVAIANSFNSSGGACGNNNPCEVSGDDVHVERGARYAQQVAGILACLTNGVFDASLRACWLTKP